MDAIDLSVVHPLDPFVDGVTGFHTCIADFLRHCPARWRIEIIGVTADPVRRPAGQRMHAPVHGRPVDFLPVLHDPEPDLPALVPLSLRFGLGCALGRVRPRGTIVQFHRFESALGLGCSGAQSLVHYIHNHPPEILGTASDVRWKYLGPVYRALLDRALHRARAVVAVDPRTPRFVRERTGADRARVLWLPQWADSRTFHDTGAEGERVALRRALEARLGVHPEASIVLYAGRFETQKNLPLLLDSVSLLVARGVRVHLVLVGKGRLRAQLEARAAQAPLGGLVHVLDAVPRAQLRDLYRAADVVAISSSYEAGPRVLFETLACGTPVVSTAVGQACLVLRGEPLAGRVSPESTPEALGRSIEAMLAVRGHPEVRAACMRAVRASRPDRCLEPVFALYESWLTGSASVSEEAAFGKTA